MQRSQFLNLVEVPQHMDVVPANALKELLQQFPYCQTLQLLYLKQLHDSNHFSFNQQLKVASIYAGDRVKLYELIHNTSAISEKEDVKTAFADNNSIQETINQSDTIIETSIKSDDFIELTLEPTLIEDATIKESTATFFETENNTNEKQIETALFENAVEHEKVDLQNVINQRINELLSQNSHYGIVDANTEEKESNYLHTDSVNELQSTSDANIEEVPFNNATLNQKDEIQFTEVKVLADLNEDKNQSEEIKEVEIELDEENKEENSSHHSFLYWLNHSKMAPVISDIKALSNNPEFEKKSQEKNVPLSNTNTKPEVREIESSTTSIKESSKSEPPYDLNDNTKDVDFDSILANDEIIISKGNDSPQTSNSSSLIDQFIQNKPRIENKKNAFYSPANAARASVIFDSDVVSETLAEIFVKQQHYQKAINAYEKLSLKFPEKSISFATRIEKIKEEAQKK